jgi:DNA repair protein RadC
LEYNVRKDFLAISDWREEDRPRERLMKYGSASLTDTELLAIIFGSGTVGKSAVDIARHLLAEFGNISNLAKCDYSEFKKIEGIGDAKAVTLAAAFEISRRIEIPPFFGKKIFRSPEDIANYYIPRFRDNRVETFKILLLNTANQIFREVTVSEGLLNLSVVHPREVFRIAITESAAALILMHNHPSGNKEPSKEDIQTTKQLVKAADIIGIKILDHIIIAGDGFTSLTSLGIIKCDL